MVLVLPKVLFWQSSGLWRQPYFLLDSLQVETQHNSNIMSETTETASMAVPT